MEKWLLREAAEVWNYHACAIQEPNPRIRALWERMTAYELGHLHRVMDLFRAVERRDPAEILSSSLPDPLEHRGHRTFIAEVLREEVDLRSVGTRFVHRSEVPQGAAVQRPWSEPSPEGSPSELVTAGWWRARTEVSA